MAILPVFCIANANVITKGSVLTEHKWKWCCRSELILQWQLYLFKVKLHVSLVFEFWFISNKQQLQGNEIIISVWPSEIVTPKYHIACSVKLSLQKPIITSIQQKTTDSRNVKYVKCRNYYQLTQINFLRERNVTKILITSYFLKKSVR